MKILVISDIHGNSVALKSVLDHVKNKVDAVWCLGDVVGYGPNPNECIAMLQEQANLVCVLGNHDAAAAKDLDISNFNREARLSVDWTKNELSKESLAFLQNLPETEVVGNVTLSHGSPRHPVFEYLMDTRAATENFKYFDTDYCLVGHTHLPVHYHLEPENTTSSFFTPLTDEVLTLSPRAILNPGSVGQPRDRDPRAAFTIYDIEKSTWDYQRIDYDIGETQKRMEDLKLPHRHSIRLSNGW